MPAPISRRVLDAGPDNYYGVGGSLVVWRGDRQIPVGDIMVCNLADTPGGDWAHTPPAGKVAVDPVLGRLVFGQEVDVPIRVSYRYGFSAAMGGGEYTREAQAGPVPQIRVPEDQPTLQVALDVLTEGGTLEIGDSGRYQESLSVSIERGQSYVLRATVSNRPLLWLDGELLIDGPGDMIVLDGLLIVGSGLRVRGGLRELRLRHCTLVPGLRLAVDGTPEVSAAPSLVVESAETTVVIEHSIVGPVRAHQDAEVFVADSIVDATG